MAVKIALVLAVVATCLALPTSALPSCMGLTEETCKPCDGGGPAEFCDNIKKMCANLFCHSMCTKLTWKATLKASGDGPKSGFRTQVESEGVQKAMTAQFTAYACSETFQCCDKSMMYDYVENAVYGENYPKPYIPIEACLFDPEDKAMAPQYCDKCKSSIQVQTEPLTCPEELKTPDFGAGFFFLELEDSIEKWLALDRSTQPYDLRVNSKGELSFFPAHIQNLRQQLDKALKRNTLQPTEAPGLVEQQASININTGEEDDIQLSAKKFDVGPPAHKSFYERCKKLEAKVKGALGGLQSTFQEKTCGCLGCCQDVECFFPTTISKEDEI